eukprot:scaffold3118_cov377-Prasinococcus_capsulatus_cf.AAC.2
MDSSRSAPAGGRRRGPGRCSRARFRPTLSTRSTACPSSSSSSSPAGIHHRRAATISNNNVSLARLGPALRLSLALAGGQAPDGGRCIGRGPRPPRLVVPPRMHPAPLAPGASVPQQKLTVRVAQTLPPLFALHPTGPGQRRRDGRSRPGRAEHRGDERRARTQWEPAGRGLRGLRLATTTLRCATGNRTHSGATCASETVAAAAIYIRRPEVHKGLSDAHRVGSLKQSGQPPRLRSVSAFGRTVRCALAVPCVVVFLAGPELWQRPQAREA